MWRCSSPFALHAVCPAETLLTAEVSYVLTLPFQGVSDMNIFLCIRSTEDAKG